VCNLETVRAKYGDLNMILRWKINLLIVVCVFWAKGSPAAMNGRDAALPEVWTVRQAVTFAVQNNPDGNMARRRMAAANAAIAMEQSAFYPKLDLSAGYSRTDNPMYSFGNILNQGAFSQSIDFNNPGRTDDLNMGIQLRYRLYNGGRDLAGLKAAEAGGHAALMELSAIQSRLAFNAVKTFNLIIQAKESVKAHQAAVDAINASLAVAQARFDEGIILKADVLNMKVELARTRENLIQARNHLSVARKIFLNLLGVKNGRVDIDPTQNNIQKVPATMSYAQRYELQGADAMVHAAEARLRQARAGSYPTIDGYAGYDIDQGWEVDGSGHSWQAGIQFRYNLFNGHHTSAAISKATAMLAEAREQKNKTELAIGLEVQQAELALNNVETRLRVSEKSVEQARESARIYRIRFKEGEILSSDLIAAETRLTDAVLRRSMAEAAHRIAIAELRRALGLPQFPDLPKNPQEVTMSSNNRSYPR